jgi:hypothetical protein
MVCKPSLVVLLCVLRCEVLPLACWVLRRAFFRAAPKAVTSQRFDGSLLPSP